MKISTPYRMDFLGHEISRSNLDQLQNVIMFFLRNCYFLLEISLYNCMGLSFSIGEI
jgi:hypothetical protein